jgi:hypothetical protein
MVQRIGLLVLCTMAFPVSGAEPSPSEERVRNLEARIAVLESRLSQLSTDIREARAELARICDG